MSRTHEDMDKEELIGIIKRLSIKNNDWYVEVKRLREGIRSILSDYDITELIRDVAEEEWNFEQQALVRMKELIV